MRIAYVSLHWPRTLNSGVGKKIQSQIRVWNQMGHEARLFMHTVQHEPQSELIEADYFFYINGGKIRTEFNRINAMKRMLDGIRDFQPDIIYLRYGIYVYPARHLMNIAPVIEEINTNDLTQHEGLGKVYSLYNKLTRGIFLSRIQGLVAVSHELAASPAFAEYEKNTCVIANGVDLKAFPALSAPSNRIPQLVFIGKPGCPWHGVDKLIKIAILIPDLHVDIVGYQNLPEFEPLPKNITLHGYLAHHEYQRILKSADVAVSSLALHRVQLEEASPLKSRECLAFGLPLIIAYEDTDLKDMECDFLLRIPNKEDNIQTHAHAIRNFAYHMQGKRVQKEQIQKLDQRMKEEDRLRFFEKILQAKRRWRNLDD